MTTKDEVDAEKMRKASALLSCPFCGGTDLYFPHGTDPAIIKCGGKDGCGAESGIPDEQSEAAAVAAWNRRALPIPVDASTQAANCQQAGLVTVDAGLLDEVKTALRAAGDALADSQWSGGSAERRVSAALARLDREVG